MPTNDKCALIQKLKSKISNADTPQKRLRAATELLARFGATQRAVPLVKHLITELENFQDASLVKQKSVRELVEQLETNLKFAIKARDAQKDFDDEADAEDEVLPPAPAPVPAVSDVVPIEESEVQIGGLDLLPGFDTPEWTALMVALGHDRLLTKSEFLDAIDIPLWIGEKETVGRKPINLQRPSSLKYDASDSELNWQHSASWAAASGTEKMSYGESLARYYSELVSRANARLLDIGITIPIGVYVPLEEFSVLLDAAYQTIQPPYVTFQSEAAWQVILILTESGKQKRFINLLRARARHGLNLYGKPLPPKPPSQQPPSLLLSAIESSPR